jgi:hypothetical protein
VYFVCGMARPKTYNDAHRTNLIIERELFSKASRRAYEEGYSFAEYVARLLVNDLGKKNTAATRNGRTLRA